MSLGTKMTVLLLLTVTKIVNSEKIKYSMDAQGKLKPNYCKRGACIKCVDMGDYFGCDKCVKYETRKIGIAKCEDMTLQERESKFSGLFLSRFRPQIQAKYDGI